MAAVAKLNKFEISALDTIATCTKSISIALAVMHQRITVEQAWEAARIEENYQIRQYGHVEGIYGHSIDMEYVRHRVATAASLLNLLRE